MSVNLSYRLQIFSERIKYRLRSIRFYTRDILIGVIFPDWEFYLRTAQSNRIYEEYEPESWEVLLHICQCKNISGRRPPAGLGVNLSVSCSW
jgi:hypothetical protein